MRRRDFLRATTTAPLIGAIPLLAKPAALQSRAVARATSVEMTAGTAKTDITPRVPLVDVNGRIPPMVYAPIHARCLTLNDGNRRMIIVTYDLNCLDVATPILRERVEDELGIDPAYLVLLATHNHQAPIMIVPDNFEYGRWLADEIFDLIKEAIAREDGPVRLEFGFGHGYFVRPIVDRWGQGSAPADYEVQLLKVMNGNRAVALLFNHPTHPLMGPEGTGPSHPGFAMDEIEARFPGALALYADACGGNQRCIPPEGIDDRLEACRQRGHDLAEVVVQISEGPMLEVTGPIQSRWEVVDLPFAPPVSYQEALELAQGIPRDIGFVPYPDRRRGTNWIRALLQHYEEGMPFPALSSDYVCTDDAFLVPELDTPRKYECRYEEVLVAKIGSLTFIAIQGEPVAPIGARIKDVLRHEGPTMVFGYFAEHNLYIPTREMVRTDVYQAQTLRIQYASPVGWAPEVEDEMVDSVIAMASADAL